jgi:hypothetical protein
MPLSLKAKPRFLPRDPRIAARLPSMLLLPDDREIQVHIRNLSPGGFMAESSVPMAQGTWFGIEISGRGIIRARVCWTDADAFGASFQSPLQVRKVE